MTDFCKNWKQNSSYDYPDPLNSKTAHIPYAVVTDAFGYNAYKIAPQIQAKTLLIAAATAFRQQTFYATFLFARFDFERPFDADFRV